MATTVKFPSKSGSELEGALSEPAGTGKAGGVVIVQEWFGVTPVIKSKVDRFAQAGFLALAPDLYHGKIAKDEGEAASMMGALDMKKAVSEIGDAAARLKADARSNGKVAITGFCLGGGLTLAAVVSLEGIDAVVPFYGLPGMPPETFAHVKTPIQAHFARTDDWAKASIAEEIQKKVRAGGGSMELFVYDAGHAFMRSTDPAKYHADSARLAWDRAIEFLKKHIA
jgi:carboxymethylenebutenolidase